MGKGRLVGDMGHLLGGIGVVGGIVDLGEGRWGSAARGIWILIQDLKKAQRTGIVD